MKVLEDMKGKTIAVQLGTVQETYSQSLEGVVVKSFQKFDDCVREVILGRVDATLMDTPSRRATSSTRTSREDQDRLRAGNHRLRKALAMNLGETELIEAVNKALAELEEAASWTL